MTKKEDITHFAPELHIPNGTLEIDFYKTFGATENFCLRNDDGSIHVAELAVNGAIFHVLKQYVMPMSQLVQKA